MADVKKPFRIIGLADLHDRIEMLDWLKKFDAALIAFYYASKAWRSTSGQSSGFFRTEVGTRKVAENREMKE